VLSDQDPLASKITPDVLLVGAEGAAASGPLRVARLDGLDADDIESRFRAGALDGVHLTLDQLAEFARKTLPELERKGVVAPPGPATTLRERLGLARPANQFQPA
jgi:hypothetical protein